MSSALYGLILIGFAVLTWRAAARSRERALIDCMNACERESVQLLDQTVSLSKVRPAFIGKPCLRLYYTFEFSRTGTDRDAGQMIIECGRTTTVVWPAERPTVSALD